MNNDIFVYIEHDQLIKDVSLEILAKAQELKDSRPQFGINVVAILLGDKVTHLIEECIYYGADKVIYYEHDALAEFNSSNHAELVSKISHFYNPEALLIGGSVVGRDLAPRVSAKLMTGLTADATSIEFNSEDEASKELWITRPAFGGNLYATIICPEHRPQMATIRGNVFSKMEKDESRTGEVIEFDYDLHPNTDITYIEKINKIDNQIDITKAQIIVSGGRGVSKDLDVLEEAANALHAQMAVSRALVDEGIAPKNIQVGQTGKTVRPSIYLACGISGAVQHTAGMDKSDMIIAINSDENAPIFDIADISIVGNARDVLSKVITKLR